jgi:hypothetical protein
MCVLLNVANAVFTSGQCLPNRGQCVANVWPLCGYCALASSGMRAPKMLCMTCVCACVCGAFSPNWLTNPAPFPSAPGICLHQQTPRSSKLAALLYVVPLCFMETLATDLQIHDGVVNELLGGPLGIAWLPWDCGRCQIKAAQVTSERKLTGPSGTGTRDTTCFRQATRNNFLLTCLRVLRTTYSNPHRIASVYHILRPSRGSSKPGPERRRASKLEAPCLPRGEGHTRCVLF